MARRSVNVIVSVGSAATLAASVASVAAADGYWPGGGATNENTTATAGVVSEHAAVEASPGGTSPLGALQLSPLPPMELSPLDGPEIPKLPVVRAAPSGMVQAPAPAPAPPQPARRTKAS